MSLPTYPWGLCWFSNNWIVSLPSFHIHATASIEELAAQVKMTHIYSPRSQLLVPNTRTRGGDNARLMSAPWLKRNTPPWWSRKRRACSHSLWRTFCREKWQTIPSGFTSHVGSRYGAAPVHHFSAKANFLEILVESVAPIAQIRCPLTAFRPPLAPNLRWCLRSGSLISPVKSLSSSSLEAGRREASASWRPMIASYDKATTPWNDGSRPYNWAILDDTTTHVDGMHAILRRHANPRSPFLHRRTDRPTSVFLLTDGRRDVDGVLSEVNAAVASYPPHAFLRVSVLGIGNSASTAMCKGIARVRNGTCMTQDYADPEGRAYPNIAVAWGVRAIETQFATNEEDDAFKMVLTPRGSGKGEKSLFDEAVDHDQLQLNIGPVPPSPKVVLPLPPQAAYRPSATEIVKVWASSPLPPMLTGLHRESRPEDSNTHRSDPRRLLDPANCSCHPHNLPNAPEWPPIHALAMRRIIQDVEDGQYVLVNSIPDEVDLLARGRPSSREMLLHLIVPDLVCRRRLIRPIGQGAQCRTLNKQRSILPHGPLMITDQRANETLAQRARRLASLDPRASRNSVRVVAPPAMICRFAVGSRLRGIDGDTT
ncbi:hypothetical protein B0H11DRAFT_2193331 [Mycena galericulata]|nr:hypothetical protein B0H11DRAFT_2193331 [Mycena galericulata]